MKKMDEKKGGKWWRQETERRMAQAGNKRMER
jgi:hypothetical protein